MRSGGRLPALAPVLAALLGLCSAERRALVLPRRLGAPGARERFRLEAFGERLTLELEPDSSFLAPDFTLQYLGGPPPPPEDDLSRCFYSGTVNRDPGSAAALSLCAGLRGAFSLRGRQYLIQPAPGTAHRHGPHLLRLRGVPRAAPAARCAVAEAGAEAEGPEPAEPAGTVAMPRRPPQGQGGEGRLAGMRGRCLPRSPPRGAHLEVPTWLRDRRASGAGAQTWVHILSGSGLLNRGLLLCSPARSLPLFLTQKREAGGRRGSCPAPATWRPCWWQTSPWPSSTAAG